MVVWDTATGKAVLTLNGPTRYEYVGAIQLLSPDARLLASMPRLEQNPGGAFQLYTGLGFELVSYEADYAKPVLSSASMA